MLLHNDIVRLNITCEDFNIPRPKTLLDAETLHKATAALLAQVQAEVEPDHYDITLKNLNAVHAAIVAWPGHTAREAAAIRLEQVSDGKVTDEWTRFGGTMFESLRAPFDKAAAAYTGGDDKSLPALTTLAQTRDILTSVHKATTLRTDNLDPTTRVLDVVSVRHALYVVTHFTNGLERYSADWFKAVRDLDGVTIKWMTPADQVAMDKAIPQEAREREGVKVKV